MQSLEPETRKELSLAWLRQFTWAVERGIRAI